MPAYFPETVQGREATGAGAIGLCPPRSPLIGDRRSCSSDSAAEFFLERELYRQGEHYEPWYRFHYPVHYYYDLLVGLDILTALGFGGDPRLGHALSVLKKKRLADGRWILDAVHPDVEWAPAEWLRKNPKRAPKPFALEEAGRPSKMITRRALTVLRRIDGARSL